MKYKTIILGLALVVLLLVAGCTEQTNADINAEKVMMFKDPNCGCCVGHAAYLEQNGYSVEKNNTTNMDAIKTQYQIPAGMRSCHTAIFDEYFVEGHVPMEAINKLLEEKPDIDGIALPGMPSGSPGMPGAKKEAWEIYSIKDGKIIGVFTTV
ncbi:MAG: CopG family transcriptional regulator [Candidatus Diapherotrites archaeon]|uniref:CopG family transcriptional regulator n=1 Tax=Candidatus Iainarchaeum sp. TaxID=3101447 RepID=A0A8T5GE15_9ARCH|nr:CopG family transcriptional regulator [Candidatus Diapherotrites archaeon]MBT7241433.1 CopG family transcriptional regulator [Candidatus Diapherotrites archaeon]